MHTHLTLPRNYEKHILILKTATQLVCDCHDITFARPISWMKRCTPTETRTVDTVSNCGINFSSMVQVSWFSLATLKHDSWTTEKQKKGEKNRVRMPGSQSAGWLHAASWRSCGQTIKNYFCRGYPAGISRVAHTSPARSWQILQNALLTRKNRLRYSRERALRNLGKHWKI